MTDLGPLPRISASDVADDELRCRLALWHAQRIDGMGVPLTREIDPFAVPALAGSVILYDVDPKFGLKFRLVGEDVKARIDRNPKGLPPEAVVGDDAYGQLIVAQLRHCLEAGLPLYSHHDFRAPGDEMVRPAIRIAMPYGNGRRVTRLLCYQKFSGKLAFPKTPDDPDWRIVKIALVDRA
ncbi:MAG: hypothetical protein R8L07_21470 [Alphaproteobacteria bacterium]|nr:hypothetical protein [Alphaproteobacteria bacterium]